MGIRDRVDKYCKRCDQTLDVSMFGVSKGRYDGLQAYCSECMKKYRIEHYRNDKEAHYHRNKKSRQALIDFVREFKEENVCADCGLGYPGEPWLLEFDHLPQFKKEKTISEIVRYGSKNKLLSEMEKCELVCVLCHRRRTAARGGWADTDLPESQ